MHDIGKTYQADDETLHTEHQSFNFPISEKFLGELNLPEEQLQKLKDVISYKSDSMEMQVVKDADAIALYADKRLYMLFIEWAVKNKLDWAIKRKIEKFNLLYFNKSREIGKPLLEVMERDWDKYQSQHQ